MSLINLGAGLSAMGKSTAAFAGVAGMQAQKAQLEKENLTLADSLKSTSDIKLAGVQGDEARKTTVTSAEAQGGQLRETQDAANKLPMTEAQRATVKVQQQEADARTLEANRPTPAGYGAGWLVRTPNGGYKVMDLNNDTGGSGGKTDVDPSKNNISAQTGLSQGAVDYLLGKNTGRSAGLQMMRQKEVEGWGSKNGINTTTLKSQADGYNKVLEQNIIRNNAMVTSEREIAASIETVKDALKDIDISKVNWGNVAAVWAGKQVNDADAITVADQLGRLREEYAGFNMAANGHMNNNGSVAQPDDAALQRAGEVISNGISSGGIDALGKSISASAKKNHTVLLKTIEDTNAAMFELFGAKYHRADAIGGNTTPPPATTGAVESPTLPPGVPSGSRPSKSLPTKWLAPDGKTVYDNTGKEIPQ